jgi:MinD-like ATPase involved in chromosome partitioning or flagellar assembly/Tfp pilus assembly protein PilF
MKTITFYSYKGGVGRSLALSNIAKRLSEFGKRVCIIDFDLEAPGLHLKFNDAFVEKVQKGIVDYIYEFTNFGKIADDINKFVTHINFNKQGNNSNILLIGAGDTFSREYWQKLSSINWNDLFYKKNSVGVDFFYNLKMQIQSQLNPDFLLIDSRTGITEISGITMSIFADEVVLLAANNEENLQGIAQVLKTLIIPENSIDNNPPKINFVLCRIPFFESQKDKPKETFAKINALKFLNKRLKNDPQINYQLEKVLVIHSDPELELQEKLKIGHRQDSFTDSSIVPIGLDYLEIFEEITKNDISEQEREKFEYFMKAEFLIERAMSNSDSLEKIKGLKAALKINPQSTVANFQLAVAYYEIQQFDKSLETIEEGLKLITKYNHSYIHIKCLIFIRKREYNKALQAANSLREANPDGLVENSLLATSLLRLKRNDEALKIRRKLTELYSDVAYVWNDYANALRIEGRLDEAMNAIYRALELEPQNNISTITLAEIYAAMDNKREFYKNLELSFSLGTNTEMFQNIIETEDIYSSFIEDDRFKFILDKYKISIDLSKINYK